jgi:hypothetical protein
VVLPADSATGGYGDALAQPGPARTETYQPTSSLDSKCSRFAITDVTNRTRLLSTAFLTTTSSLTTSPFTVTRERELELDELTEVDVLSDVLRDALACVPPPADSLCATVVRSSVSSCTTTPLTVTRDPERTVLRCVDSLV